MWIASGSETIWKRRKPSAYPEMAEPALHNKAGSEFLLPQLVDERSGLYDLGLNLVNAVYQVLLVSRIDSRCLIGYKCCL